MRSLPWPALLRIAGAVVLVLVAIFLYTTLYPVAGQPSFLYLTPFIPAIINALFIIKLNYLIKYPQNIFFRKYMILSMVKFVLNLFLFILLIIFFRANPVSIIIVYLLSYFLLFVQEIVEIQLLIRKTN